MGPFFIYILYSEQYDRYYIGQTSDIEKRVIRHNSGYVKSTKKYRPWLLKWSFTVESRSKSMEIESKIKAWKSKDQIRKLINNQIDTSNW